MLRNSDLLPDPHLPENIRRAYQNVPLTPFQVDMLALLKREKSGHAPGHIFKGALTQDFNAMTHDDPNYGLYHGDMGLLSTHGGFYSELARKDHDGPVTLIECCPGAASNKTRLLLDIFKPDHYRFVESSIDSAQITANMLREDYPEMKGKTSIRNINAYTDSMRETISTQPPLPEGGRRIIVLLGTLGNMPGFFNAGGMPGDELLGAFKNLRSFGRPGDMFLYSVKQIVSETESRREYSHPLHEKFAMKTLENMKKELFLSEGFDISALRYQQFWRPELLSHGWNITKPMTFTALGEKVTLNTAPLVYANCFRYPQYYLDGLFGKAGHSRLPHTPHTQQGVSHQVGYFM